MWVKVIKENLAHKLVVSGLRLVHGAGARDHDLRMMIKARGRGLVVVCAGTSALRRRRSLCPKVVLGAAAQVHSHHLLLMHCRVAPGALIRGVVSKQRLCAWIVFKISSEVNMQSCEACGRVRA